MCWIPTGRKHRHKIFESRRRRLYGSIFLIYFFFCTRSPRNASLLSPAVRCNLRVFFYSSPARQRGGCVICGHLCNAMTKRANPPPLTRALVQVLLFTCALPERLVELMNAQDTTSSSKSIHSERFFPGDTLRGTEAWAPALGAVVLRRAFSCLARACALLSRPGSSDDKARHAGNCSPAVD